MTKVFYLVTKKLGRRLNDQDIEVAHSSAGSIPDSYDIHLNLVRYSILSK